MFRRETSLREERNKTVTQKARNPGQNHIRCELACRTFHQLVACRRATSWSSNQAPCRQRVLRNGVVFVTHICGLCGPTVSLLKRKPAREESAVFTEPSDVVLAQPTTKKSDTYHSALGMYMDEATVSTSASPLHQEHMDRSTLLARSDGTMTTCSLQQDPTSFGSYNFSDCVEVSEVPIMVVALRDTNLHRRPAAFIQLEHVDVDSDVPTLLTKRDPRSKKQFVEC